MLNFKPEFYLTYLLSIFEEQKEFCTTIIQEIMESYEDQLNAMDEFISSCVHFVIKKVRKDFQALQKDPVLFIHTLLEILIFEKRLVDDFGYCVRNPISTRLLEQDQVWQTWISIERGGRKKIE